MEVAVNRRVYYNVKQIEETVEGDIVITDKYNDKYVIAPSAEFNSLYACKEE